MGRLPALLFFCPPVRLDIVTQLRDAEVGTGSSPPAYPAHFDESLRPYTCSGVIVYTSIRVLLELGVDLVRGRLFLAALRSWLDGHWRWSAMAYFRDHLHLNKVRCVGNVTTTTSITVTWHKRPIAKYQIQTRRYSCRYICTINHHPPDPVPSRAAPRPPPSPRRCPPRCRSPRL